jgi:hypothetical protein
MTGACAAGCAKTPLVPPPPPPAPLSVFSTSWGGPLTLNVTTSGGSTAGDNQFFECVFSGGTGSGFTRGWTNEFQSNPSKVFLSGDRVVHPWLSWSGLAVGESVAFSARCTATDSGGSASAVVPSSGVIIVKRVS